MKPSPTSPLRLAGCPPGRRLPLLGRSALRSVTPSTPTMAVSRRRRPHAAEAPPRAPLPGRARRPKRVPGTRRSSSRMRPLPKRRRRPCLGAMRDLVLGRKSCARAAGSIGIADVRPNKPNPMLNAVLKNTLRSRNEAAQRRQISVAAAAHADITCAIVLGKQHRSGAAHALTRMAG